MSHKLKGRLRLVDPADPDDISEIDMSDDEESAAAAASSSGIDGGASTEAARAPPPSRRRRGSTGKAAKKTASPIPARLRPDGAASSQPRRAARSGGLLSRLRNIRKKEVSTSAAAAAASASPAAASPKRQSMASDRLASGQSSPGSIIPIGRASLAGPRETLGIDAFTKPHRASTANSLMTSELLDNSSPVSRSATPSALVLKDYGVEHQPDLMQPNLKRESTARYSIAHSVEASLIDSWSVAGDDDEEEDGISAVSGRSRDDGENDWMRTGMAPMVSDSYTDIDAPSAVTEDDEDDEGDETESEGHGRRTPTKAAAVAAAAVPATAAVAKPPMARTVTDRSAATTADYYYADDTSTTAGTSASRAAARRSDVDRLLLQLGDTGATGAALGAGAAAAAAAGSSSIVSSRQSTTLSDADDYEEEAASSVTPSNARSSVAYSTEIDDSESAIVPDDSVSVRAMQRAAQEEEDGAVTPTAAKTTDPDKLALLLADMEPAFDERSEDEGELEEEEEEEEDDEDEDEELTEAPVAAAAVGRRTPAASTRSATKAAREARRRRRVKLGKANQGANRWLEDSALTPEQMHYFIKAMVSRELEWEWARAFAFDPSDRPPLPAAATSSSTSKVREYDIFRKSKVDVASLPKFPLLRFLYDSAFCMLPIFGHGTTTYAKRQKRAEAYWSRGVAPLLRILQNRSFSHRVDRCGEGDGSAFSAETTSDVIQGAIHRAAVRFITATINVGGKRDVKEGWPWPSAKLMKLPAFLPYRLPLAQQSRGAFEVDVVVMRPQGKEPSYILRLRRQFGHPSIFVIRSEAQFLEYASALNEALPRACIKRPPPVEMAAAATMGADGKPMTSASSDAGSSTAVGSVRSKPPLRTKPSSDAKGLASGGSAVAGSADPAQAEKEKGRLGFAGMFGSRGKSSGAAAAPPVAAVGGKGSAAAGSQSSAGVDRSLLELRDNKRRSVLGSRSSLPLSPGSPPADDDGSNVGSIRSSTVGPGKNGSAAGAPSSTASSGAGLLKGKGTPKKTKPPPLPTIDYNLRRLQLRDWLRDTLSARGAGHHAETREFLTAGFFTDKDLKSSTKAKIAANEEADRANTKQREEVALEAGEEVLELRDQIEAMWEECKRGQGFLEARAVFEQASSFSELPEDYQRLVSYLHLKIARFLLGTFVTGDESLGNLRRLRSAFSAIPWKLLRLVLTEPTGVMVADLRRALTAPKFVSGMISILFDDDSRKINEDLDELKRRLPADYLRKIRRFVEATSDHTKRLIRDQARRSGIPLVSAIERGSDEPLLEGKELGRVIQATRGYVAFMETRPSFIDVEVEARINKDVALILDLQQALRLYSARRDGQNLRELARSETFRTAVEHVVQPLLDHLARQHHRKRGSRLKAALKLIEVRGVALLELLEALRTRVQDPAKSIDALTTFLDSHAHDTVQLISHVATPLFTWLHHVARTVNEGSSDLAREWPLPKDGGSNGASAKKDSSGLANPLSSDEGLDGVRRLTERAWLGRLRDMELASRWIAGDVEADLSVQVLGSGGGGEKTRTLPILPEEPKRPELDRKVFDGVLPGFREALARVLESRED